MKRLTVLFILILIVLYLVSCNISISKEINELYEFNSAKNNNGTVDHFETTRDTIPESPAQDFLYQYLDDGTIAVSYKGTDEHVVVPKQINGTEVTTILHNGFQTAKSFLKTVILPNTIKTIEQNAFLDCSLLMSINIPESVSQIGTCAFKNCSSLKSIEIYSDCLNENSLEAFSSSGLEKITLGEGITRIPSGCFTETQLSEIKLPSTVKEISSNAFAACKLEKIILNEGLITIEHKAFVSNLSLKEIIIPKTVLNITEMAFSGCSALEKVVFEGNAPASYEYSDIVSGVWNPVNTNYTVYYYQYSEGFTTPEWYGYPTKMLT